jgi:hypothetical protein
VRQLDERIRAARPREPQLPPHFTATVLARIQAEGLAIRPRWRQRARPAAYGLAALLALGAAVLLSNAGLYELDADGSLELLYFGGRFLGAFLGRVPYDVLLSALALAGLGAWLLRRGALVHTRVAWLLLLSYGVTGGGGLALAGSGINYELRTRIVAQPEGWPLVGDFYRRRAHWAGPPAAGFRLGRVLAVDGRAAVLLTPTGEQTRVTLPPGAVAAVGDTLRLGGQADDGAFRADSVQVCDPARAMRHFGRHGMDPDMMRRMAPMMRPGAMGPGGMGPGMTRPGGMGPGMMGPGGMAR